MPKFGSASKRELKSCVAELQTLANEVIKIFDFSVLEGHRNERDQNIAFAKGASQRQWPLGEHNSKPSKAMDVSPWPIDWKNEEVARQRFVLLAGFMLCTALRLGIKLRWGGDWNGNLDTRDEKFRDYGHFEVVEP
jgi:hypothetical protein